MRKRSRLAISLRTLLVSITVLCIGTALAVYTYEERYGRNYRGNWYFKSLGASVIAGDPCPPGFVYYIDAVDRTSGLTVTDTPDWVDRLAGRRLSYPAIRELNFRGEFVENHQFHLEHATRLRDLAPDLELLQLPPLPNDGKEYDPREVDAMVQEILQLKNLRLLSFQGWPVTDDHVRQFRALPKLQVVQIVRTDQVTDRSLDYLREIKDLRFLGLGTPRITASAAEAFYENCPQLIARINNIDYGDRELLYRNRIKKKK